MPGAHGGTMRSVPRQMAVGGMQRMQPQGMPAYNLTSQAGMSAGMNPGGIPMQRGVSAQTHQQQQQQQVYCVES
jgi:cyclin-dependent kinase 8/11